MVSEDPVLARRARIARIAALGKRIGYAALGIAIVSFIAGVITSFAAWTVALSTIGLFAACVILPVPIVLGYGVRAAARDERNGERPG